VSAATHLPVGPVLLQRELGKLPLAGGRWLRRSYLDPMVFADYPTLAAVGIVTAIYLVTDLDKRIRWLGQASRDDDLVGRLAAHYADEEKRCVFATLRVLHLADHTPPEAIDAIEGRCADRLGLRGTMGRRRWPRADNWLELVA